MPNGNVLMIAWERKAYAQAVAAGRNPNDVPIAPGTGGSTSTTTRRATGPATAAMRSASSIPPTHLGG
jgi:hypothetical protein